LYAEEDRTQVFELKLRKLKKGEIKLGQVTISYDAIQGDKIKKVERVREIVIKVAAPEDYKKPRTDKEVRKLVLLQKASQARKDALVFADRQDFKRAQEILEAMAEEIKATRTRDEDLLDLRDQLLEEARDMEFGAQRYDSYSRKSQSLKVASAARYERSMAMSDDLHMRHNLSKISIERDAPPPLHISWRGGRMELRKREIRIGSAPDNEIVLQEALVEEYHCRLIRREGDWYLEDRSQGGTMANAGRINAPFRLSQGDIIRIGKMLLELE
jgi:hypothetical protein